MFQDSSYKYASTESIFSVEAESALMGYTELDSESALICPTESESDSWKFCFEILTMI